MDWTMIIAFVVGILAPFLFGQLLPNKKFHGWGFALGKKASEKGKALIGDSWDKLENNLTGSFLSFAEGFKEGADSDD